MGYLKRIGLRFKHMMQMGKKIRVDSKFLIVVFFICFVPICLTSLGIGNSSLGNVITIRTMFSSILGYIIENICTHEDKNNNEEIIKKAIESTEIITETQEDEIMFKNEGKPTLEIRVIIIGHVLLCIIVTLIIGMFFEIQQSNESLVLLKNTGFACIGFLISATRNNLNKK